MWLAAALLLGSAAGPNGLQVLHSPVAEQTQQRQMLERLSSEPAAPSPVRKPHGPPTEAEKRAAAWRADHLTCASAKGRTREQFEAECKPASANP